MNQPFDARLRREISGFEYLMIWHPRLHTGAAHPWLRRLIAEVANGLGPLDDAVIVAGA